MCTMHGRRSRGRRMALKFKKFIDKEKEKDICKMCGDIKSKCTGYKCWIR